MKSNSVFEKPEDWPLVSEERYRIGWWKYPFPEFGPDTPEKHIKREKKVADEILAQYKEMHRAGYESDTNNLKGEE